MDDDIELLRRFASAGDESAFAELVGRRMDFVYNVAARQVGGDAHLAQDVAQDVFLALAQQANALCRHPVLLGWLYTTTRFAASKHLRVQTRWANRQQKAQAMNAPDAVSTPAGPEWNELRPVLDEAMHELGEADRTAILLRYFENRRIADIGTQLGLAEHAAGRRVERALDKLRLTLAKRGIVSTAAALASTLAAQPALTAPSGFAVAVTESSMAGIGAGAPAGIAALASPLLLFMKNKTALATLVVLALIGLSLYLGRSPAPADTSERERLAIESLRADNARLRAEVARLAPAPVRPAAPTSITAGPVYASDEERRAAILKNLTLLRNLASQYNLEKGGAAGSIADLVGPGKYATKLVPVAGEDYSGMNFFYGLDLEVTTPSGLKVVLKDTSPWARDLQQAIAAYRAVHGGSGLPLPEELAPFFGDPPPGTVKARMYAANYAKAHPTSPPPPDYVKASVKALTDYRAVHDGRRPNDVTELAPYFENPDHAAAFFASQSNSGIR